MSKIRRALIPLAILAAAASVGHNFWAGERIEKQGQQIVSLEKKLKAHEGNSSGGFEDSYFCIFAENIGPTNLKTKDYIHSSAYRKYKKMSHVANNGSDYADFVIWSIPEIRSIAKNITSDCRTDIEKAQAIADYVYQIPWSKASENVNGQGDYVRYPIETLCEQNGDCEDKSILCAALMKATGFGVVLTNYGTHLALAVKGDFREKDFDYQQFYFNHNGERYYNVEVAGGRWHNREDIRGGRSWKIGEMPDNRQNDTAHVYEVK